MMSAKKRIIALGLVLASIACSCMVAFAATTSFDNYKVGAGLEDPYTKRTEKAGGQSYENSFYVTITGMSPSNTTLKTQSIMELRSPDESPTVSEVVQVENGSKESGSYTTPAEAGRYYKMKISFFTGSSNQATVSGRYTP